MYFKDSKRISLRLYTNSLLPKNKQEEELSGKNSRSIVKSLQGQKI